MGKKTNYGVGVACVVFLIIAGWYGQSVMADMTSWNDWNKPAEVAKMWKGSIFGLIGFLMALGVNFLDIVRPIISVIPGMGQFVQAPAPPADVEKT